MYKYKNILLCTLFSSTSLVAQSVLGAPVFIDASVISNKNTISISLPIDSNAGAVKYNSSGCRATISTEKESFWPVEDLQSAFKNKQNSIVKLKDDGLGIVIGTPCGTKVTQKYEGEKQTLIFTFEPVKVAPKKPNKRDYSVRPRLRPSGLQVETNSIEPDGYIKDRYQTVLSIQSMRANEVPTEDILNSELLALGEELITVEEKDPPKQQSAESEPAETEIKQVTASPDIKEEVVKKSEITQKQVKENTDKLYQPFSIGKYLTKPYIEQRKELMDQYSSERLKGYDTKDVELKLAELHLAYGFNHEALSYLNTINPVTLSEIERFKVEYLKDISELLIGDFDINNKDRVQVVGNERFRQWADYALWTSLALIREQEYKKSRTLLPEAVDQLSRYPFSLIRTLSPEILTGTVSAKKWSAARDLSMLLDTIAGETEKPYFNFALGEAALATNRFVDAFDAYARASMGDGPYAQKARLAIVKLGLDTNTMPATDAIAFLEENKNLWKGDKLEFDILVMLSDTYYKIGEVQNSLIILGDAIRRFSEEDFASSITDKAKERLNDVYSKGLEGNIPLDVFFDTHNIVKHSFYYFDEYDTFVETYADKLSQVGGTTAADREYQNLIATLELTSQNDDPEKLARIELLKIKRAEALIKGSNYKIARDILDQFNQEVARQHLDRYFTTLARLDTLTKNSKIATKNAIKSRDIEALRIEADGNWNDKNYINSQESYQELKDRFPDSFNGSDAIRLLLSAYNNNDQITVISIVSEFPALMELEEWNEIAQAFTYEETKQPLNSELMKTAIDKSDDLYKTIENIVK